MAYEWPQYLTCLTTLPQTYLKELGQQFLNYLRSQSIVVSEKPNWACPDKLRIVAQNYRQENGNLILDSDDMSEIALSRRYSEKAIAGLRTIGVRDFSRLDFFRYLEMFTTLNGGRDFQSRSLDWHSRIAAVLVRELRMVHPQNYGRYTSTELSICRRCCIIPLQGGSWTSFDSGKVYLRSNNEMTPTGLHLRFIDGKTASDPDRYSLFRELGVEVLGPNDVCKNILDLHRTQQVLNLDIDELVSHAVYLFSASYSPQQTDRLRFIGEDGQQISNEKLYVFWANISKACHYFPPGCHVISRLHGNYEVAVDASRKNAWLKWLLLWPNLSRWPPIHENGILSRPMRYILQNQGSKSFLEYMKVYPRPILDNNGIHRSSLLAQIAKVKVSTESGDFELRETALPALREKGNGFLNILNIEQPDDPRWAFLDEFGVLTKVDIRLYLQQLRSIRTTGFAPSENILTSIYQDMGQHIYDREMVLSVSQKVPQNPSFP
jgi:hypothetical protein